MSRVCVISKKGVMSGNSVSHSNRKTRRKFKPNVHFVNLHSESLNRTFRMKISAATLRTIDFKGGFDEYIMKVSGISTEIQMIKKLIRKSLPTKTIAS